MKKNAAEEGKETSIPEGQKDSESQSKQQSHPKELSENLRKRDVRWGERHKKKGQLIELVSDQNPDSEAPPRSKIGRERKEQRRCQGKGNCQKSDGEE